MLSLCNLPQNLLHALVGIFFDVVLPQPQHRPSLYAQLARNFSVPPHVSLYLFAPVLFCRPLLFRVPVPVPKVAVAEHKNSFSHLKVGAAEDFWIHFKPCACLGKHLAHPHVDGRVLRPYPRHYPAALFLAEHVCHALLLMKRYFKFSAGHDV